MAEYNVENYEQTVKEMENINNEKEIDVPLFQDMNVVTPFKDNDQPKNVFNSLPQGEESEVTVIGSSTIVDANINCGGSLIIKGQINGNIEAENIKVEPGAKIVGDVTCKTELVVEQGTNIKGNIASKATTFAGNIEGNLDVAGELKLLASSVITGDIVTGNISVTSGATINGRISIKH